MRPRILMLPRYDALGASSRLRMLQYVPSLRTAGFAVEVSPLFDDEYVADLYANRRSVAGIARSYVRRLMVLLRSARADVIWVEKEIFPWLFAYFETALIGKNTAVVVDYDDAVFHRYDKHPFRLVRRVLGSKIDDVMRRADLVTVGNAYLAERAWAAGAAKVEWLPTVIDLDRYPAPRVEPKRRGELVIGWIGSPATAPYLQVLAPALMELRKRYSFRCVAVGARADQLLGTPFESLEWHEYDEVARLHEFDLGVMPLTDGPWERGKCGYKLIQYMACGLPVVASPVGVNRQIVVEGENGYLASTTEGWIDALERVISDDILREGLGSAGRRQVELEYSLQVQAPRLAKMLHDVVRMARH